MKVFADFHHIGLYHSLQMLFEGRLGWQVYRPIGTDWYSNGYWKVYPHINVVNQYLGFNNSVPLDVRGDPVDKLHGIDTWLNRYYCEQSPGVYSVEDTIHLDRIDHRAMTLDVFKDTDFDIILASIPEHIEPFKKLISVFSSKTILIISPNQKWTTRRKRLMDIIAIAFILRLHMPHKPCIT